MAPRKKKAGANSVKTPQSSNNGPAIKVPVNANVPSTTTKEIPFPELGSWLPTSWVTDFSIYPEGRERFIFTHDRPRHPFLNAHPPQIKIRRPVYKGLTPYQLEEGTYTLFTEWYFILISKMSKLSDELSAYCLHRPSSFHECFQGNPADIQRTIKEVQKQFSDIIKAHLGPSFDHLKGTLFTREYVEVDFMRKFNDYSNLDWFFRKIQVVQMAKNGNFHPYSTFLQANCVPEVDIWLQLVEVCLYDGISEEAKQGIFKCKYEASRYNTLFGPIEERVEMFQQSLKERKLPPFHESVEYSSAGSSAPNLKDPKAKRAPLKMPKGRLTGPGPRKMAFKKWLEQEKDTKPSE